VAVGVLAGVLVGVARETGLGLTAGGAVAGTGPAGGEG
jgi:hypothetical protein